MRRNFFFPPLLATAALLFSGCGATVPDIKEPFDHAGGTGELEFEIKRKVYCELKTAVRAVNYENRDAARTGTFIPLTWGAHLSLSLQVDETSALNPGLALNTPQPNATSFFPGLASVTTPQSFSLGLGGTLSSTSTRIDKFDSYYSIDYLMVPPTKQPFLCDHDPLIEQAGVEHPTSSSLLILSDLRIREWLEGAMFTSQAIPSVAAFPNDGSYDFTKTVSGADAGKQPDTVTTEIKFVIITSGNVTPTWKLVRVSANSGTTPFFNVGRTRTHDLIITIGPNTPLTANTLLASQINSLNHPGGF